MKLNFIFIFFFLFVSNVFGAQWPNNIEKKYSDFKTTDTGNVEKCIATSQQAQSNNDSIAAMAYCQKAIDFALKLNKPELIAAAYSNAGNLNRKYSNYINAMKYYQIALQLYKKSGDSVMMATLIRHIGLLYHDRGNYSKAMEQYVEALKIYEKNSKRNIDFAWLLRSIGRIYHSQGAL